MMEIFTLTPDPIAMTWRWLILLLCAVGIFWLYCVLRCHFSNKDIWPLGITIRRAWIEATLIYLLCLSVYFVFFERAFGWQGFVWDEWSWSLSRNTYLMLLPEILMLILLSIFFCIQTKTLLNIKKSE